MQNVDKLLAKRYALWKKQGQPAPPVQVAMVVIDPRTGEIRALIGGRDYGESQLNHALAHRQPGSVFKPFVYAAAFDNAVQGLQPVVTPVTTVDDIPTTFDFDGKEYTPDNYGQEFYGTVTVRDALIHSLNVATVKVAEMIGYQRVVDVARQMGLGNNIKATPAVALGAYEMTPVDVAAGYTAFAANGMRAEPLFIRSVVTAEGKLVESHAPQSRPVLDPRVAFLTTSLMEDVINHGTGYPVRALGFNAPAAGKTGTSRDGWFAGYTSNLLCVVWVGFDDNRNLGLTGGNTAAPIWGEFMKRAVAQPAVSQHAAVHAARWCDGSDRRPRNRPARHRVLPAKPKTSISSRAASPLSIARCMAAARPPNRDPPVGYRISLERTTLRLRRRRATLLPMRQRLQIRAIPTPPASRRNPPASRKNSPRRKRACWARYLVSLAEVTRSPTIPGSRSNNSADTTPVDGEGGMMRL